MINRTDEDVYKVLRGLDDFYDIVRTFHAAVGHPPGVAALTLKGDEKARRIAWMQEELGEYARADNLVDQCDALGDLLWFVVGTMVCTGVRPSHILGPITTANMAKIGPDGKVKYRGSDGKIQKPDGWMPPEDEIAYNLERHYGVWKPRGETDERH